jgi:hypothetical protein
MKPKYSCEQYTDARRFLFSTRDVGRSNVFAALSLHVCDAANMKYRALLSAAIVEALDIL